LLLLIPFIPRDDTRAIALSEINPRGMEVYTLSTDRRKFHGWFWWVVVLGVWLVAVLGKRDTTHFNSLSLV
jgi:hypothetical protein